MSRLEDYPMDPFGPKLKYKLWFYRESRLDGKVRSWLDDSIKDQLSIQLEDVLMNRLTILLKNKILRKCQTLMKGGVHDEEENN